MYHVSVIVPIYNAESTIKRAIDSVINQTIGFDNIELILVDDNSTDNSKKVIEHYANKYPNIKFIKLSENSGLPSKPRNVGIENSSGEYVMFLDNDDIIIEDCCETLYEAVKKYDADIGYCNIYTKLLDGFYTDCDKSNKEISYVKDKSSLRLTCWGYLIRKEYLMDFNIRFPLMVLEDGLFITEALGKTDNIIQMPYYNGYAYTVESEDSLSYIHDINIEKFLTYLDAHYYYLENVRKYGFDEKELLTYSASFLILMFIKVKAPHNKKVESLKKVRDFEKILSFDVEIASMPINLVNKCILKQHYTLAILMSSVAGKLYKNNKIKNFILKKFSNLRKVE